MHSEVRVHVVWCLDPSTNNITACAREGKKGLGNNYTHTRALEFLPPLSSSGRETNNNEYNFGGCALSASIFASQHSSHEHHGIRMRLYHVY